MGNIDLNEFLDFFEIRNLYNIYYEDGDEICKELITKREGIIALLFDMLLKPLFEYDQLRKWQSLTDYVKVVYSNTRKGGTSWPTSCLEFEVPRSYTALL